MNAQGISLVIGAVFAGIISVVQLFHGAAISTLEDGVVHKDVIRVSASNINNWQKEQDRRLDNLEREHDIHEHFEEE